MKLEYGDFYKFIVSIGIALISLGILVPWLFFREPFDLLIFQEDITMLTPVAQSIIAQRQALTQSLSHLIPLFSITSLSIGVVMVVVGGIHWKYKTQKVLEELNELNKKILERQLEELSLEEVEASREEEAKAVLIDDSEKIHEAVISIQKVEEKVASVLKRCFGSSYDILANRHLGLVYYDLVLLSRKPIDKDFIVDVKYIRKGFKYGWVRDNVLKAVYANLLYQKETNRISKPIVFIVGADNVLSRIETNSYWERINNELTNIKADASVVFIQEEKIDTITCQELEKLLSHIKMN